MAKQDLKMNTSISDLYKIIKDKQDKCYKDNQTYSNSNLEEYGEEAGLRCPRTFDGLVCWDSAPANTTVVQPCPDFITGFNPYFFAKKFCTENGTWYRRFPESKKTTTDYTNCIDYEDLKFRSLVNNIYVVGYCLSLIALMISIGIFIYFRSLHCTRIRIHMHLFMSLALNNLLWIIWYRTVVNNAAVVMDNRAWCQVLHVITNYFMVTSYFWMFCEGLHLHIALVIVFVKDDIAMRWFVALGWGLSLLIVVLYAAVRYLTPKATLGCWMGHSDTFWIIIIPVVISLFASLVFLINVVRVLLTKLHPAQNRDTSLAAKKAARATLILVPLFGLHFVLIPFRPHPNAPGEKFYQIISALLTSLQGLCVAVLFCFTNHDVMVATRAQFSRFWSGRAEIPMNGVTAGESLMNTRENMV